MIEQKESGFNKMSIAYKSVGLTYAEQIIIESMNGDHVYYRVMKSGRPFGGFHVMNCNQLLTEEEAKRRKKIFC